MWLLLEVGIDSTSEHCEPELLIGMFYFCDVLNSVEMWLLAPDLNQVQCGQILYKFPYRRSADASQFEFVDLPSFTHLETGFLIWD